MREVHEVIGDFVIKKRSEMGLNSTQFSSKIGLARSTIFNIERKVGTCVSVSNMNSILIETGSSWAELGKILDENNEVGIL